MTTIYLLDDEPDRHVLFAKLLEVLNGILPQQFAASATYGVPAHNKDDAKAFIGPTACTQALSPMVQTKNRDAILLLDLILEPAADWQAKALALIESTGPQHAQAIKAGIDTAVSAHPGFEDIYAATAIAVIAKRNNVSIILVSRNSKTAQSEAFAEYFGCKVLPSAEPEFVERLARGTFVNAGVANRESEYEMLLSRWYLAVLDLLPHPDPAISRLLMVYGEPFSPNISTPWWHDACQGPTALATAGKLFSAPPAPASDLVKALFMHSEFDAGFDYNRPRKQLTKDRLLAICGTLGLDAECASISFLLPCNPGMAFLCALKELQSELNQQFPLPVKSFTFGSTKGQDGQSKEYSVTIRLSPSGNSHALNHFCEFMRRIGAGAELPNPPNGGVSLALWNACHARLGRLYDHANTQCFRLFREGTKGFIAWPCFAENSITLRWCQHLHPQAKVS